MNELADFEQAPYKLYICALLSKNKINYFLTFFGDNPYFNA